MTRDQIIHQRRVRVLEHAGETGNVSETCRTFGISRKTFYEWRRLAGAYGEALMPKARRRPQLANATPTHVLHELLALAVAEPTLGCRPLADRLETGAMWCRRPRCKSSSSRPAWADAASGSPEPPPWPRWWAVW